MTPQLSKDLSDALHANADDRLPVVDPTNNRLYVLIDAASLQELERQDTYRAIQAGLESMQAGGGQPLDVAMSELRAEFETPDDE